MSDASAASEKERLVLGWRMSVTLALLLVVTAFTQFIKMDAGDKPWLLETSHLWLSGKSLYDNIVQPNLPLITWLYALLLKIAALFSAEGGTVVVATTILLAGASSLLCYHFAAHHEYFKEQPRQRLLLGALMFCVLIVVPQAPNMGDREHLMMICVLPFIIFHLPALATSEVSKKSRVLMAVMAGLVPCFKPHGVVLLAVPVLTRICRERSLKSLFSQEYIITAGVIALYGAAMACFTTGYFSMVLPLLGKTYSSANNGIGVIMEYATSLFAVSVPLADFRWRYASPLRRDIVYLAVLVLGGFAYALVNNGWVYTFNPVDSYILMLTVWLLWEYGWLHKNAAVDEKARKGFVFGRRACLSVLIVLGLWRFCKNVILSYNALACVGVTTGDNDCVRMDKTMMVRVIEEQHAKTFGMISSEFSPWTYVQHKTGALMVTRFNHLFMLPKFIEQGNKFEADNRQILEFVADAFGEDMDRYKPDLMFVDGGNNFSKQGTALDMEQYFLSFPKFVEAWKQYEFLTTIDVCGFSDDYRLREAWCKKDVYKRR